MIVVERSLFNVNLAAVEDVRPIGETEMADNVISMRALGPDLREFMNGPRGQFLVAKALHYAIKYIGVPPAAQQSGSDREDMLFMLNGCFPNEAAILRIGGGSE